MHHREETRTFSYIVGKEAKPATADVHCAVAKIQMFHTIMIYHALSS